MRHVERNALRADAWRWGSLWRRVREEARPEIALAEGPLALPEDWSEHVNKPHTEAELEALRRSAQRGAPYGSVAWQTVTAANLGLTYTLRPGRPAA